MLLFFVQKVLKWFLNVHCDYRSMTIHWGILEEIKLVIVRPVSMDILLEFQSHLKLRHINKFTELNKFLRGERDWSFISMKRLRTVTNAMKPDKTRSVPRFVSFSRILGSPAPVCLVQPSFACIHAHPHSCLLPNYALSYVRENWKLVSVVLLVAVQRGGASGSVGRLCGGVAPVALQGSIGVEGRRWGHNSERCHINTLHANARANLC
jgi:hypothetical protein